MVYYNHKRGQQVPQKGLIKMKKYLVTIYTRSNACINPNKELFQQIFEAETAKGAKISAWHLLYTWFNSEGYSRNDLRIEVKPFTAE